MTYKVDSNDFVQEVALAINPERNAEINTMIADPCIACSWIDDCSEPCDVLYIKERR